GIEPPRLHQIGHRAQAPGPHLPAELFVFAAVAMMDGETWLAHQWITGADDAIEHIEVAAAGQWRSGIESIIESAEAFESRAAEDHVRAGSENSCAARIRRRIGQSRAEAHAFEVFSKAAHLFEDDLRAGFELHGENGTGERTRIRIRGPCFAKTIE